MYTCWRPPSLILPASPLPPPPPNPPPNPLLPPHLPLLPQEERVDDALSELGLVDCQHTKIGTIFIKGVSGGQRRRVSIGCELIMHPTLLFLDEPTSGECACVLACGVCVCMCVVCMQVCVECECCMCVCVVS